ncbi:MAG: M81 family metallopeptidase [bacterium]
MASPSSCTAPWASRAGRPRGRLSGSGPGVVGDAMPVAVTYDLHGNLTPEKVAGSPLLFAYRTNPHRDHARVGERAGRVLLDTLDGKIRPVAAWRSLPMVLGGGTTVDFLPTMRPLFRHMKKLERDPRVLGCSLFMCHIWNDHPHLGWAVHVLTDGDAALAERLADDLAERAWAVRTVEPPRFPTVAEAIEKARGARLRRKLGAVCMSDVSDVVAAGAPGENHRILEALRAHGRGLLAYVPFRDAAAVEALWATGVDQPVAFSLGGRLHPEQNQALAIEGTLRFKRESLALGRQVVVESGDLRLVITEGPPIAMKPEFYRDVGLDPAKADIVVVKSFFPWLIYFARYSRMNLWVQTEGITDLDAVKRIPFADPVFPIDEVADWRPIDRQRRGA